MCVASLENTKELGDGPVMTPGGEYNAHSRLQAAALSTVGKLVEVELRKLQTGTSGRVRVADYGCSEGGNSVPIIRKILEMLGDRADVILEDLPANDWVTTRSILSEELEDVLPRPTGHAEAGRGHAPPCCYSVDQVGRELDRDYDMPASVVMCGISFYEQDVPDACVHLGYSSSAMQWLSRRPEEVAKGFMFGGESRFRELRRNHDSAALRTWEKCADEDWRASLRARSKELVEGGAVIISVPISLEDTTSGSDLLYSAAATFDALSRTMQELELTDEERSSLQLQACFRTRTELESPFAPDGRFSGLRLEKFVVDRFDEPCWDEFISAGPAAFAEAIAETTMGWAKGIWMHALTAVADETRAQYVVSALREGLYNAVLADPYAFQHAYVSGVLVLRKVTE